MIIDKFKLFESLSIGAIERGEYKISLNESEQLDEGVLSSIKNFFSRMLGGAVSKLDKILRKYKDNELDYWTDWADARGRFAEADALSREAKSDPVDRMKYEEQKERVKKLQAQVETKRKDVNDALSRQATNIIKDSTRLKDYWEMKKAKVDEEAARESFDEIKKSSDDTTLHDLFDTEIQKAAKAARKKDAEFKEKYGSVSSGKFDQTPDEDEDLSVAGIKIKDLLSKPISEIQQKLKSTSADKLSDILSYLEKELKKMKDQKDDDIKNIKNRTSDKDQQAKEIDEISKKVKSASDLIQSKINYIDQLLLAAKGNKEEKAADTTAKTDATPTDDVKKDDAKKEETKKPEVTVDMTQVKKNFAEAKGTIEEAIGDKIDDAVFDHLKNDLIALFGMIIKAKPEMSQKTLQFGLIDFAVQIYKYKEKGNLLKKDLSKADLDKQFDKYTK